MNRCVMRCLGVLHSQLWDGGGRLPPLGKVLSKREKEQFALAEKSKDSIKLIDEKVNLEFELSDLRNELYHIERRRVS